jgi:hypothetical protein
MFTGGIAGVCMLRASSERPAMAKCLPARVVPVGWVVGGASAPESECRGESVRPAATMARTSKQAATIP